MQFSPFFSYSLQGPVFNAFSIALPLTRQCHNHVCQSCCVESETEKVNREQKARLHPSDCEPDSLNSLCKIRDDLMFYPQDVFTYFVGEFVEILTVATSLQMLLTANLHYQLPDMKWQKAVEFPSIIIHCTHRQYCVGSAARRRRENSKASPDNRQLYGYYLVRFFFPSDIAATVSRSRRSCDGIVCRAVIQYQACHR
jgi:hypothetical protein